MNRHSPSVSSHEKTLSNGLAIQVPRAVTRASDLGLLARRLLLERFASSCLTRCIDNDRVTRHRVHAHSNCLSHCSSPFVDCPALAKGELRGQAVKLSGS